MILTNVTKVYGKKSILKDVSLDISKGIYGLLGSNGAGKTTLIKIIIGEESGTSGTITLDKSIPDIKSFYNYLGYLPQDFKAPQNMIVKDYLTYIAMYKGIEKKYVDDVIENLASELNFQEFKKMKVAELSGGMKQKVGIAQVFLNDPKFVILDEPSAGLDISERRNLKNFITRRSRTCTVMISTHIVSDIEYLANKFLIIDKGTMIRQINHTDAIREIEGLVWEECCDYTSGDAKIEIIQMGGGVIANTSNDYSNRMKIRYISSDKIFETANRIRPELSDYYLWVIEGARNEVVNI